MKTIALLLMAVPVLAQGPIFQNKDPYTQQEFQNVYHDLQYPNIVNGTASTMTITNISMTSLSVSTATITNLIGTTTNNNAATGNVGEYRSSFISTPQNTGLTTVWGDLTSLSLTAGDWDVSVNTAFFRNTAVWTQIICAATTTSGNSGTGATEGDTLGVFKFNAISSNIDEISLVAPVVRFSLSATTTVYLKYRADYSSGGPPQAVGRISARRVR